MAADETAGTQNEAVSPVEHDQGPHSGIADGLDAAIATTTTAAAAALTHLKLIQGRDLPEVLVFLQTYMRLWCQISRLR